MSAFKNKNLLITYFLATMLALSPFAFAGLGSDQAGQEMAATANQLLNPDEWFKILKKNITIPLPGAASSKPGEEIKIPTPEEALKEAAPKLQEVNRGVREETGLDLAKFIGWLTKILKVFFQVVVGLLEQVSKALGS